MNIHSLPKLILLSSAVLSAAPTRIQAPDAPWRTIHTSHYRIHFPARGGFEPFAKEVSSRIEGIHAKVTEWVGYEAKGPIDVVLRDPSLDANGMAFPLLKRPWVELWKTPPENLSGIGHHRGWEELLVVHELAHMHHMMRPQNKPSLGDKLRPLPWGPITLNAPRWVIEGYATYIEGRITGSGRPHSAYRASLIRQWALQGKLPSYDSLNGSRSFRGGSMAYLIGSAYLEWLERQNPKDPEILRKLWKHLTSRRHRPFDPSFQATFGINPRDGYDRWRAEVVHGALELERRVKEQKLLREGEVFARMEGEVTDLALSPDGTKLLARVLTEKNAGLRVWDLADKPKEEKRETKNTEAPDPNEVEDRKPEFPQRKPAWKLGRINGRLPWKPRWTSSCDISYLLKTPNGEGVLEPVKETWQLSGSGKAVSAQTLPAFIQDEGSPFWKDLHARIGFGVHVGPSAVLQEAGKPSTVFAAIPSDGTWNLYSISYEASGSSPRILGTERLTRTLSAAWNPAPTPDGKFLYYVQLRAGGCEIRRLDLSLPPVDDKLLPVDDKALAPNTILSPADEPSLLPPPVIPPSSKDYSSFESMWISSRSAACFGPAGNSVQMGIGGTDILGRLNWHALASLGDGAGPRGGSLGVAYRGWRWAPSLQVFSALERPSSQRFMPVHGMDRERRGAELALIFENRGTLPFTLGPFVSYERIVSMEAERETVSRSFSGAFTSIRKRWSRGEDWSLAAQMKLRGGFGRTDDHSWSLARAEIGLAIANPVLPITLRAESGRVGGDPTSLDHLHLGGVTSSIVPAGLDGNRVEQPALPAFRATGNRLTRWRGEVLLFPEAGIRGYIEHTALWDSHRSRSPYLKVTGLEWPIHERVPDALASSLLGRFTLTLGLHRILNETRPDRPMKDRTVFTLSLILRP